MRTSTCNWCPWPCQSDHQNIKSQSCQQCPLHFTIHNILQLFINLVLSTRGQNFEKIYCFFAQSDPSLFTSVHACKSPVYNLGSVYAGWSPLSLFLHKDKRRNLQIGGPPTCSSSTLHFTSKWASQIYPPLQQGQSPSLKNGMNCSVESSLRSQRRISGNILKKKYQKFWAPCSIKAKRKPPACSPSTLHSKAKCATQRSNNISTTTVRAQIYHFDSKFECSQSTDLRTSWKMSTNHAFRTLCPLCWPSEHHGTVHRPPRHWAKPKVPGKKTERNIWWKQ